jgi:hypothetical protein
VVDKIPLVYCTYNSCVNAKELCPCHTRERCYGLVKGEMIYLVFFSPKLQGAVSGIKCPIKLHSETDLCELVGGLCAVSE